MERNREKTIERTRSLLQRAGFYVADTHAIRPTSFDLAGRRDATLLLVKVLKNIDALDSEEADRLIELGRLFPAVGLVIGSTSGATDLEPGVVYMRYGVPIMTEETLQEYVEKALPPFLFSSPGGIFGRIDGERLRRIREEQRLSLGALASAAGVSRRTIQLYEEGAGAEVAVIERLEEFLGEAIAQAIDLFTVPRPARSDAVASARARGSPPSGPPSATGDALRDGVVRQLDGMGLEVVVTVRAPFDAFSRTPESDPQILLTGVGSLRAAHHRAVVLHGLARVSEGHAMFVVREASSRPSILGLPILSVSELKRHRDRDELLEEITEREES